MNGFFKANALALLVSTPLCADFLAGEGSARAGYTYAAGIGGIVDSGETLSEGNLGTGVGEYTFSEDLGESRYATKVEIDSRSQRVLEFEGDLFLAIVGSGRVGGEVWYARGIGGRRRLSQFFR